MLVYSCIRRFETWFLRYRERELFQVTAASGNYEHDEFNGVWYAKYSMGPVSIGYSESYLDAGVTKDDSSHVN